jgi:hypothetical protein
MTWVVVSYLLDFVILVAIWFNCAVIRLREPSWSSAFVQLSHFIWVAKMVDQTSGYAIVCCTYSGNVRSCTWRVKMATESSVFSYVFSFHLDLLSNSLFSWSLSVAATFMTVWMRNHRLWNGSLNSFVSKLLGHLEYDRPLYTHDISIKVKTLNNDTLYRLSVISTTPWQGRGQQAWPCQVVKIAWFTVVRTSASLTPHHARSCMYCRLSSTGTPSVNTTTVLGMYFVPACIRTHSWGG